MNTYLDNHKNPIELLGHRSRLQDRIFGHFTTARQDHVLLLLRLSSSAKARPIAIGRHNIIAINIAACNGGHHGQF